MIEAKNILLRRLILDVRPQNFRLMSAKQVFENITSTREENAATPHETAIRSLWNIRFTTTDDCRDKFMQYFLSVNSVAEFMVPNDMIESINSYSISKGYASCPFVLGTNKSRISGDLATDLSSQQQKSVPLVEKTDVDIETSWRAQITIMRTSKCSQWRGKERVLED